MGARSPINQRPRRGGLKCEFCTRSYPSAESLRTHQNSLHSLALKEKEKKRSVLRKAGNIQKGTKVKLVSKQQAKLAKAKVKVVQKKLPEKPVRKEPPAKPMASLLGSKVMDVAAEAQNDEKVKKDLKASTKKRKVEFQCPICIKTFPVYFSAFKHIQHKHQSHEMSSIEPVRKEFCIFCNIMVSNDADEHKCEMRDLSGLGWTYVCAACDQTFTSTMHFDIHVREVHHEGVESMFFPSMDEFNEWKSSMETQTNSSYVMIGKYHHTKKIYRCSKYRNDKDDSSTAYFCPSTLIFQEFTKGIQVHFYKEHFGHAFSTYVLHDSYKAYSITDMLHEATGYSEITNVRSAEDDLYCQFKKLMESIVVDAAKINVEKLKVLTGKALQMISILKTYKTQDDEDDKPCSLNSNSSSDLTKAIEILNNTKAKRSVNTTIEVPAKRLRNLNGSTEKSPILQKASAKAKLTSNTFSLADDRDDQKILQELGGANANVSSPTATPMKKTVESPSFNDTYKHFVEKNLKSSPLPARAIAPKKKTIVKTKMGQFKPNVSPKKPVKSDRTSRSSLGNASDIVYEIKEQENDCNILILKI